MKKNRMNMPEGMVERSTWADHIGDGLMAVLLVAVVFICLIPLWHTLMASLSDGQKLLEHSGMLWLPVGGATLDGYKLLFSSQKYMVLHGLLNTILYVTYTTLLGFIINVVGGYILSRKTKLRGVMVMFVMITMMFSGGTIPTYMVVRALGMTKTPLALIVPGCTNAMFVIMLMNGFLQVPESTIEAAKLDGAGTLRIMFQIALPQGLGMALVTVINTVVIAWNSWFNAMIYVPTQKNLWPLQLWIKQISEDASRIMQSKTPSYTDMLFQHAAVIISILPIIILFPFFVKKLEKGMAQGGVKE